MPVTREMQRLLNEGSKSDPNLAKFQKEYAQEQQKAAKLIKSVADALAVHAKGVEASGKVDYGYIGDLSEVISRLKTIVSFVGGEE